MDGLQPFTRTTYTGGGELSSLISQAEVAAQKAQAANVARQKKIEAIMDEIIARYQPGGGFGAGYKAELETQKTKEVGAGTQALISSGLYGTEMGAGVGRAWEASVGAPARLKLEDIRYEALSKAQLEKAGFLERIEEPYPDYGMLAQLASQAANVAQPISSMGGGRGTTFEGDFPSSGQMPSYSEQMKSKVTPATAAAAAEVPTKAAVSAPTGYYTTPGGGTATLSEWEKAQANLKKKYPQYGTTGITTGTKTSVPFSTGYGAMRLP